MLSIQYVFIYFQIVDLLTKPLSRSRFEMLRKNLSVVVKPLEEEMNQTESEIVIMV